MLFNIYNRNTGATSFIFAASRLQVLGRKVYLTSVTSSVTIIRTLSFAYAIFKILKYVLMFSPKRSHPFMKRLRQRFCNHEYSSRVSCVDCNPGGGYLGQFLLGMCRWPFRTPTPLESLLWPIIDPILVTFGQMVSVKNGIQREPTVKY